MIDKPYSQACENNKQPILDIIAPVLEHATQVFEIGSGTGQHAVFFADKLPHLTWQCSDQSENLPGIRLWLDDARLPNLPPPLELDVARRSQWPEQPYDAVFSANTAHIMHWPEVENMFDCLGCSLKPGGHFLLYGPFNYGGRYTSESNARFDEWLKAQDPLRGIRDFEKIDQLASTAGLRLRSDYAMPANNRLLHWQKIQDQDG